MTKEQKTKILEIIDQDAEIQHYYEKDGKYCILGGLCAAAKIRLIKGQIIADSNPNEHKQIQKIPLLSTKIEKVYGLTLPQQEKLQWINDWNQNRIIRQNKLKEYVNKIPVEN